MRYCVGAFACYVRIIKADSIDSGYVAESVNGIGIAARRRDARYLIFLKLNGKLNATFAGEAKTIDKICCRSVPEIFSVKRSVASVSNFFNIIKHTSS